MKYRKNYWNLPWSCENDYRRSLQEQRIIKINEDWYLQIHVIN